MQAASSSADVTNRQTLPLVFTGKATEYFSIWIVNVALTILTLGIYSAWAKVRTQQYFYGNTWLDDTSFRYLADPRQILKGRVIAFGLFMAYYFSGLVSPLASAGMFWVLMLLFPALLVMSMAFRLRNSAWRNVRFDFAKDFKKAYLIFSIPAVMIALVATATILFMPEQANGMQAGDVQPVEPPWFVGALFIALFLMFPWFEYLVARFRVLHARYGSEGFDFHARVASYYWMYLVAVITLVVLVVAVMVVMTVFFAASAVGMGLATGQEGTVEGAGLPPGAAILMPIVMTAMIAPVYFWIFAYFQTRRTNLVYNNIDVGGHKLRCKLRVRDMFLLYLTNTIAIVLSLGLLMPWARVRTARYRASRTQLQAHGDLGEFANSQRERQSAFGEEVGEMLDLDIGF